MVTNHGDQEGVPVRAAELEAMSSFIYELGHLKRSARTGWLLAGIAQPETVAEHSFRTAAIAYLLAQLEGADVGKTVLLATFHDIAETRTGDIPSVGKAYLKEEGPRLVVEHQLAGSPPRVVEDLLSLVDAFESPHTLEARLARDADKLECLAQALEYRAQGHPQAEAWVQASVESVSSASAGALARTMTCVEPDRWWHEFVASYRGKRQPAEQE